MLTDLSLEPISTTQLMLSMALERELHKRFKERRRITSKSPQSHTKTSTEGEPL